MPPGLRLVSSKTGTSLSKRRAKADSPATPRLAQLAHISSDNSPCGESSGVCEAGHSAADSGGSSECTRQLLFHSSPHSQSLPKHSIPKSNWAKSRKTCVESSMQLSSAHSKSAKAMARSRRFITCRVTNRASGGSRHRTSARRSFRIGAKCGTLNMNRICGGIHYPAAGVEGLKLGRKVAAYIIEHFTDQTELHSRRKVFDQ